MSVRWIVTVLLGMIAMMAVPTLSIALIAGSASDVCAPAANPCTVTTEIDVTNNAVLDFGTRTVSVSGGGRFDFGSGNGHILSGKFLTNTSGAAINARGPGALGGMESGLVQIDARRSCTVGARPCLQEDDCQLGQCNVRRCTLQPARHCTSDASCQLGTCIPAGMPNARRCTLNLATRCSANADCQLGSCPQQLTCAGEVDPVACSDDAGCDFGACTVGEGTIDINSTINGASASPAAIVLRAADDITVRKTVNIASTSVESDGGELDLEAFDGDVQTLAALNMGGGADATGGTLRIAAGANILIDAAVDATGGDFDGGSLDLTAGQDLTINKTINANSIAGAGFGGEIVAAAGRDLLLNGTSTNNRTRLSTEGHTDATNFAGDGGTQELTAGRNLVVNAFARIEGSGSAPDGFGADLFVTVEGDFALNGEIEAKSKGEKGAGGSLQLQVDGNVAVGSTGLIDLLGGESGGGSLDVLALRAVDFLGIADVSAGSGGSAGSVRIDTDATATLSGRLTSNGQSEGDLEITACRIRLTGTAVMNNNSSGGDNFLRARESMRTDAGSQISAGGANTFVYRSPAKPPLLGGIATPAPTLIVDSGLPGCPVCGNGELDGGESCDDGNTFEGDGCNTDCQSEGCIAQTPGYPGVPLCDDGNGCTTDTCNTAIGNGVCQHSAGCDDGVACTQDECVGDECVFTPDDAECIDGNPCSDGVCNAATGCTHVANDAACDDGSFCTVGDGCTDLQCVGQARACDDGVACTADSCDEADDECTHATSDALCSDGVFCNGVEVCVADSGCVDAGEPVDCSASSGACTLGICDETLDACVATAVGEGEPCNDFDECTLADACQDGVCAGAEDPQCVPVCGNGEIETGETCDDGNTLFVAGQLCRADCLLVPCGKPTNSAGARPTATDALFTLRAAVGLNVCDARVCNVDGNGSVNATDSLRVLRAAVGQDVALTCPA